jgi:uncharacterized damage-inducible protein DinB
MPTITKPQPGEYAPYAVIYVDLIPDDGQILNRLSDEIESVPAFLRTIRPEILDKPFAEGEWTVKQILSHIMDTERVFAYRALRFARNDLTELFPVDQDLYVQFSGIESRGIEDIIEEYSSIRKASLSLFNSFSEEALLRLGKVKGNPTSVRGLIWLTAGHELHHLNSIKENYLK